MILDNINFKTISDNFIQTLDKIFKFRRQGSNVETDEVLCLVVSEFEKIQVNVRVCINE